jgi:hypothetical protein
MSCRRGTACRALSTGIHESVIQNSTCGSPRLSLPFGYGKAMIKPSMFPKVFMVVRIFVSFFAFFWLASINIRSSGIVGRFGYIAAVMCALGSLAYSWAALAASLARERNWSPRTCTRAGLPFVILALIVWGANPDAWRAAWLLALTSTMVGFLCRRLAYPYITVEQATAPDPPPRLFHN